MATQNEIHVPADLLAQVQNIAKSQGRTTDEVAADALKRYLAREWAKRLSRVGEENRRRLGLETEEQGEEYVNRMIADYRRESRGR